MSLDTNDDDSSSSSSSGSSSVIKIGARSLSALEQKRTQDQSDVVFVSNSFYLSFPLNFSTKDLFLLLSCSIVDHEQGFRFCSVLLLSKALHQDKTRRQPTVDWVFLISWLECWLIVIPRQTKKTLRYKRNRFLLMLCILHSFYSN